jgi:hypothetical protein
MIDRRTKMVSFRLSPEEHRRFREACGSQGVRSISELARIAMTHLVDSGDGESVPVQQQILELRERIVRLSTDLDRLTQKVEGTA